MENQVKYSIRINIGFLWFSQMRQVLEAYAWDDPTFEWKEGQGWLDKTFYIKGSFHDIKKLHDRFNGWSSEIEAVEHGLQ